MAYEHRKAIEFEPSINIGTLPKFPKVIKEAVTEWIEHKVSKGYENRVELK